MDKSHAVFERWALAILGFLGGAGFVGLTLHWSGRWSSVPVSQITLLSVGFMGGVMGVAIGILFGRARGAKLSIEGGPGLPNRVGDGSPSGALHNGDQPDLMESEVRERELRQTQKMEAIGTLAGGVAHDMNNILGAIMTLGSAVKIGMKTTGQREWLPDVQEILHACERGRELTRALLEFGRKGSLVRGVMSVNRTVRDIVKLLARTAPKSVEIEMVLAVELAQVEGDQGQVGNVLMNLCINAIDAMEGKGRLTIVTEMADLDENGLGLEPGRYCQLKVIDTGVGMEADVARRAFEPFFTARQSGRGTGLGLATAYGIVKDHEGVIAIDSTPGEGTVMSVYLPALDSIEQNVADPKDSFIGEPVAEPQSILLVDDEPLMRKAGEKLLRLLGFEVITAENGEQAIVVFKERREEISLVMLDMIMPVMDGEQTFRKLREIDPELHVLLCSGYCPDDVAETLLSEGAAGFVEKPFAPTTLMNKILEAIGIDHEEDTAPN